VNNDFELDSLDVGLSGLEYGLGLTLRLGEFGNFDYTTWFRIALFNSTSKSWVSDSKFKKEIMFRK